MGANPCQSSLRALRSLASFARRSEYVSAKLAKDRKARKG